MVLDWDKVLTELMEATMKGQPIAPVLERYGLTALRALEYTLQEAVAVYNASARN